MQAPSESSSTSSDDDTAPQRGNVTKKGKGNVTAADSSSSSSSSSSSASSDEHDTTPKRRVMGRPFSGGGSRPASGSSAARGPPAVSPAIPAPVVSTPAAVALAAAETERAETSATTSSRSDAPTADASAGVDTSALGLAKAALGPAVPEPTSAPSGGGPTSAISAATDDAQRNEVCSAVHDAPATSNAGSSPPSSYQDSNPPPQATSVGQLVAPVEDHRVAHGVSSQDVPPPAANSEATAAPSSPLAEPEPGSVSLSQEEVATAAVAPPVDGGDATTDGVAPTSPTASSSSSSATSSALAVSERHEGAAATGEPVGNNDGTDTAALPTDRDDAVDPLEPSAAHRDDDDLSTPPADAAPPPVDPQSAFVTQHASVDEAAAVAAPGPPAAVEAIDATAEPVPLAPLANVASEEEPTGYSDDEYESDASPTKSNHSNAAPTTAPEAPRPPPPMSASPSPERPTRGSSSSASSSRSSASSSSSYVPLAASMSQRALSDSRATEGDDATVGSASKSMAALNDGTATGTQQTMPDAAPHHDRAARRQPPPKGKPRGTVKGATPRHGQPPPSGAPRRDNAASARDPTTSSQRRATPPAMVVQDGDEVVVDTPRHVTAEDTVQQLFVRSARSTGGTTQHNPNGTMTSHGTAASQQSLRITDVRRWIRPYEAPAGHHTRLVLRDVMELEEQRKREVEVYRAKVLERDEEEQRKKEAAEQLPKRTVSEASPRLCRPKHQRPKVGPYAPRPPAATTTSAPLSTTGSEATLRRGGSTARHRAHQSSFYSYDTTDSDSIPHFMRPLPPRKEPKPLTFQPQTHAFRLGEEGGGDDDGPVPLTAEEFAQRFYQQQLNAHAAAIDKAFVKVTGSPKPPTPPPTASGARRGSRRSGAGLAATADDGDNDEEDEDDEKRLRLEEFDREMGRKHHDEEVASRLRRYELLMAKYVGTNTSASSGSQKLASSQRLRSESSAGGGLPTPQPPPTVKHAADALSAAEQRFVAAMYTVPLKHQHETLAALWAAMEQRTEAESVHHGVAMTQERWGALLERIQKGK